MTKKNTDHRSERINWNEINIPRVPFALLYKKPLKLATGFALGLARHWFYCLQTFTNTYNRK